MTKLILSMSALAPSQYRKYVKGWDKARYSDLFAKYNGDRNGYRIYLPLAQKPTKIVVPKEIQQAINSRGYVVDDYRAGLAVDSSGKRKIKIGKLLPPELQQVFANDPVRQAKSDAYTVVISRHPYDIAGMSTGRGWTSCMDLNGGINRRFVEKDVTHGSLIAYLVPSTDLDLKNPTARILLRVYTSKGRKGLWPSRIYGTGSPQFYATVRRWCAQVNADYFGIQYGESMKLQASLYNDAGPDQVINAAPDIKTLVQNLSDLLARKSSATNEETIRGLCRSTLPEDPIGFFRLTAKQLPLPMLRKLNDYLTPSIIHYDSDRLDIRLPDIDPTKLTYKQAYCALWAKYWAPVGVRSPNITTIISYIMEVVDLKLVPPSTVKLLSAECDWDGVIRPLDIVPALLLKDFVAYGIPAEVVARAANSASKVDMPKNVDPDLVRAICLANQSSTGLTDAYAQVGPPDMVLHKLMARPRCADNPRIFGHAVNRLSSAQLKTFIEAQDGVLNVMVHPYIWAPTKWASSIGRAAYQALYKLPERDLLERMSRSVSKYTPHQAALLYTKSASKLGNSEHDIVFTASLLAATWKSARRCAEYMEAKGIQCIPNNVLAFAWPATKLKTIPEAIAHWVSIPRDTRALIIRTIQSVTEWHELDDIAISGSTAKSGWAHSLFMPWTLIAMERTRLDAILTANNIDHQEVDQLIKEVQ